MEEEAKIIQINKLNIYENNLTFLFELFDFQKTYFLDDIEIEPFNVFSNSFSSEYWYLKYHLIKDGKKLIDDNFIYLFEENKINIISLFLSDLENFNLKCIDGSWCLEILKINEITNELIKNLIKNNYICSG